MAPQKYAFRGMRHPPSRWYAGHRGGGGAKEKEAPGVELELGEMRPPAPANIVDDSDESAMNLVYESFGVLAA